MWLIKVFSVIYFTAVCAAQDPPDVTFVYSDDTPRGPLPMSKVTATVYAPPLPSLQKVSAWLDVFPSEKVELNCSITNSFDWTVTWYKDGTQVQDSESLLKEGSRLTITAAVTHFGSYSCQGKRKTGGVSTAFSNSLQLTVYANKPKPILSRSSNFDKMFPGESVTFTCKSLESTGWEYLWYHNGNQIQAATDSTYRIASIDHPQSGQYHCKAKRGKGPFYTEESDKTTLQVSDPPKPSLKRLSPWSDVFQDEIVQFRCEGGSPEWTFTWYQNQKKLEEDLVLALDAEEPLLNITSVSLTHQGSYACKAHLESRRVSTEFSNTINITVYDKTPKPRLSKDPVFNPMYVGETVNFTCNVNVSSGWEYQWYKDGKYLLPKTHHDIYLGPSDGGKYLCKATRGETTSTDESEEISQDVLEIPVPSLKLVTPWLDVFPTESVTLSCAMDGISDWTYTWYKDEQEVQPDNVVSFDLNRANLSINSASAAHAGQYKCKGHLNNRSVRSSFSPALTLTVYDKIPSVTLTQDPDYKVMFSGESVSFSCHINVSSGWTYLWYRDSNPLAVSGNNYIIKPIGPTNRGSYTCRAKRGTNQVFFTGSTRAIRLEVEENKPKPSMTQQPNANKVYTGESVSFECKAEHSGWRYHWYKDDKQVLTNSSSFNIGDTNLVDTGNYKCKATRDKTGYDTKQSDGQILDVSDIPVPSLKLVTSWLDVFPTESVTLSCAMDGSSDWTYTWYKDEQEVQPDNVVSFDLNRANLSINSASAAHAGQYKCKGHLNNRSVRSSFSPALTLTVYDKKPSVTLTQDPDYKVMFSGESVSFSCHINVSSGWTYLWYRDSNPLAVSGNNYIIKPIGPTNRGSYTCRAERGTNQVFFTGSTRAIRLEVEENKPKPSMTQQPNADKVYTGESVSFECKAEHSGWRYHWYKDDKPLLTNSSSFNIGDTNLVDTGNYKCKATRDKTGYDTKQSDGQILDVSDIPVPSLKLVTPWLDVFPTESVELSCGMDGSSDWTYTWYKDGQKIQPDNTASFDSDGTTLSISSVSPSQRGQYTCSGKLKSRSVHSNSSSALTLAVYDTKARVMLMQNPKHDVMHTGDSVSFSCHINVSSGWDYLWYKDGSPLQPTSGSNHTITSVVRSDTGSYKCQVKRGSKTVFHSIQSQDLTLDIKERPQADVILLTGWSEVFSTDSLVLRCGVQESQDMWNYTWFKEGEPIDLHPSEKHTVTPQNDPEQSQYTCKGIRTGRPSYSKSSDSFKTKNLLLKRRVLLSISGCLFFGIIAVFLGCIVLRITRKPADDEDKPEEANLFLTMAQLKNRADAPCPLVDYITDEDLNVSSKGGENGTICDETTPLPVTSQEDPAMKTESQETTENNGDLVSFKQ